MYYLICYLWFGWVNIGSGTLQKVTERGAPSSWGSSPQICTLLCSNQALYRHSLLPEFKLRQLRYTQVQSSEGLLVAGLGNAKSWTNARDNYWRSEPTILWRELNVTALDLSMEELLCLVQNWQVFFVLCVCIAKNYTYRQHILYVYISLIFSNIARIWTNCASS